MPSIIPNDGYEIPYSCPMFRFKTSYEEDIEHGMSKGEMICEQSLDVEKGNSIVSQSRRFGMFPLAKRE